MNSNISKDDFNMTEKQGRETPNRRRETEIMRAELIVDEMASAVRFLGGDGPAKQQNRAVSRETGLPVTVVERLRWKKIRRPFADIVDTMREAVERHNRESLSRAKHEAFIAKRQAEAIAARLSEIDSEFYGPEIDWLRNIGKSARPQADRMGGE